MATTVFNKPLDNEVAYFATVTASSISISANASKMFSITSNKDIPIGQNVINCMINEYERWQWSCYQESATRWYMRIMAGSSAISNKTVRATIVSNVPNATLTITAV